MTLFSLRGIPIQLHPSFLWLAGLYVAWQAFNGGGAAALSGLLFGLALFGSVLLHELGHAWAARLRGIETHAVVLHPFGGFASLDRAPQGNDEILIAAAGPAVNFVLAALGFALTFVHPLAWTVFAVNLALGVFNLIPALPLDGGRVLRAFWSRKLGWMAATARSLRVSRWLGGIMAVVGLILNSYGLALIGLYIFWVSGRTPSAPPAQAVAGGARRRVAAPPPSSSSAISNWLPTLTPAARGLIIANVAVYALSQIALASGLDLAGWLQMDPVRVLGGQLWRPVTSMFGASGLFNLVLQMVMLYLFGSAFERDAGGSRTLQVYALTGLAGNLALLAVAAPVALSGMDIPYLGLTLGMPLLGPSLAVTGIMAAWCGVNWGRQGNFLLLGQVEVKWMFALLSGFVLLPALLTPALLFAELGALLAGLSLGRGNLLSRVTVWWERRKLLARKEELEKKLSRFEVIDGGRDDDDEPPGGWVH